MSADFNPQSRSPPRRRRRERRVSRDTGLPSRQLGTSRPLAGARRLLDSLSKGNASKAEPRGEATEEAPSEARLPRPGRLARPVRLPGALCEGRRRLLAILGGGVIKRGAAAFGCATKNKMLDPESQRVVCFSEIPLGFLHRIVKRRETPYGIAFHKRFVLRNGGAPLWYLELGTPQQRAANDLVKRASKPRGPSVPPSRPRPHRQALSAPSESSSTPSTSTSRRSGA